MQAATLAAAAAPAMATLAALAATHRCKTPPSAAATMAGASRAIWLPRCGFRTKLRSFHCSSGLAAEQLIAIALCGVTGDGKFVASP
jgi:homospermidine synthase